MSRYCCGLVSGILLMLFLACETDDKQVALSVNGIKPDDEIKLSPINDSIVQEGIKLFNERCASCHIMELENIGPDISDLLARRKPAWVLNFIMNTEEMLASDSIAMLIGQRHDQSCVGVIKKSEVEKAEAILEYLRMYQIWLHEINAPGMNTVNQ